MRFLRDAVLTIVILAVLAGLLLYVISRNGLSARTEPSRFEAIVATRLRNLSIPSGAAARGSPLARDPNAWREGGKHFVEHCALCHDADGRGRSLIERNLYPKPPDMRAPRTQQLSDGELYWIIANGVRFTGMPSWGIEDDPQEIWQLVAYIRRLPKLTSQDLEQITPAVEPVRGTGASQRRHPHTLPP